MRRASVAALALAAALALTWAAAPRSQEESTIPVVRSGEGRVERVPVRIVDGETYLAARHLARLAGASLHWRADVRKLVLRNVRHAAKFTVGSRFVVLDESEVFQVSGPVRMIDGEVYVPLSTVPTVFSGRFLPSARLARGGLVLVTEEPDAGPPALDTDGDLTRLTLPARRLLEAGLVSTRKSRFTLRVPGVHLGPLPGDTLGATGLIERVRFGREPGNLWMEVRMAPQAEGYRLRSLHGPERLELEVSRSPLPAGFLPLTPDFGRAAAQPLLVVVLDPAHGGADSGYVPAPGVREKDLTLGLALGVRERLAIRLPGTQVLLTRQTDLNLAPPARAEIANRAHADLYLSLHLDGAPGTSLAGLTAYVAPPLGLDPELLLSAGETQAGRPRARPVALVSWTRAAGRHHGEARGLAELLLASLASDGFGPTRLRVVPTYATEGADCPAVLLECGSLSRLEERQALLSAEGMGRLAESIARALQRYSSGEAWP